MSDIILNPDKGLGIPIKTTAAKDAITSPATGALVYDSDQGVINQYTGSAWQGVLTTAGVPASAMPAGSVVQVVQSTYAVETTSTSTSFVATGLSGSITPSASTSKVMVFARTGGMTSPNSAIYTIFRGTVSGTNLGNGSAGMALLYSGGDVRADISLCYLDSPATTSSQTYTLAMRSPSGTSVRAQENNTTAVIILMEIAG